MPAPIPEPFTLEHAGTRVAVYRWGEPGRPAALLTHGTGFCAAVWQSVAEALSSEFVVYAIDRRGHGASSKLVDAYHFADFADDIVGIIDGLQLSETYAIGHSAGATDLLLAATLRPSAFRCIFAMEPTVMDPSVPAPAASPTELNDEPLERAARRRATFTSFDEAFEQYRTRQVFRVWQPELLRAYVRYGFEQQADGTIALCCTPAIEQAILVHIVRAMAGSYRGDSRGNPFEALERIRCPTRIATTEDSQPIYKQMAARARQCIAHASAHHFAGVGHSVAQARPEIVVSAVRQFWAENRLSSR